MPEFLVATPLKPSVATESHIFGDGISIQKLSPILWDISIAKRFLSEDDRDDLNENRYWLCATVEAQGEHDPAVMELYDKARHASDALQIIAPCGGKNVFLKFCRSNEGYDNIGALHPQQRCVTLLGNLLKAEELGLVANFDSVYAGLRRASLEQIVRIQNPVLLLEHAQQIGNVPLGATMCTMGLDMLFMAGEINPFMSRVGGFFGMDTFVFPPYGFDHALPHQPTTRVRDVLHDIYAFRNIIAHGQEIPKVPYRRPNDLLTTEGHRMNYELYTRADLILDASIFLLTAALRRVFTEGLFDDVVDKTKWRAKLAVFEHRYQEAGGKKIANQRSA